MQLQNEMMGKMAKPVKKTSHADEILWDPWQNIARVIIIIVFTNITNRPTNQPTSDIIIIVKTIAGLVTAAYLCDRKAGSGPGHHPVSEISLRYPFWPLLFHKNNNKSKNNVMTSLCLWR